MMKALQETSFKEFTVAEKRNGFILMHDQFSIKLYNNAMSVHDNGKSDSTFVQTPSL